MAVEDDSDYELMSHKEIERLRRDKRKSGSSDSEKSSSMESSIERLNASINKLISILEDAQEDIIEEYQESKPMEKLNQVMDQNETIAKAIISMHNTIKKGLNIEDEDDTSKLSSKLSDQNSQQMDSSIPPIAQMPQLPNSGANFSRQQQAPVMQQRQQPLQSIQQQPIQQPPNPVWQQQSIPPLQQQPNPVWNQQMQQRPPYGQAPMQGYGVQQNFPDLNSLEGSSDLPPLDMSNNELPPLDNTPPAKKKKFLGFI